MVTANTRATDSDRNDTCQVSDAALSERQLSMEEHRQGVSAATKATTLGELRSLVSDLQIHRAPVQLPTLKSPTRSRGVWIAVAAVFVLVGAGIAWGLFGSGSAPSSSPSKGTSATSASRNGTGNATGNAGATLVPTSKDGSVKEDRSPELLIRQSTGLLVAAQ